MFFFSNDTATSEIYTLSLHDALPICGRASGEAPGHTAVRARPHARRTAAPAAATSRSEEHTSELQSLRHLVCRLLLEQTKKYEYPKLDSKHTKKSHDGTDQQEISTRE